MASDFPILCILESRPEDAILSSGLLRKLHDEIPHATFTLFGSDVRLGFARVGAVGGGSRARAMLDLTDPVPDFVSLARGMGVPAERAQTADDLVRLLGRAYAEPGPHLIEALLSQ